MSDRAAAETGEERRQPEAERPVRLSVDLAAVRANFRLLRRRAGVPVVATVKANAYGHGATAVAAALEREEGCFGFAVAHPGEGIELRRAGIERPILVLGSGVAGLDAPAAAAVVAACGRWRLSPCLTSATEVELFARRAPAVSAPLAVHLKVDTGMSRAGVELDELPAVLELVRAASHLELTGLYSHLSESETLHRGPSARQCARLQAAVAHLDAGERATVLVHVANSAAALHLPGLRLDLVRAGGALYGVDLATPDLRGELRPAMALSARIVQLRRLEPGTAVGYGGRFVARRPTELALLPLGYADGVASAFAGRMEVLVGGRRAAVVGAVSMDLITVDVTGLGAAVGDEAVLLGSQGGERIGVDQLARWSGSVPYECLCRLSRRLGPRYLDSTVAAGPP